ncbi:MAG: DPP IV N-terminal domain-containing protein [Flavobacteriales bacterium]
MNKLLIATLVGCSLLSSSYAQQKLTLEDAVLKQYTEFYPKRVPNLKWTPGGDHYSFLDESTDIPTLHKAEATSGERASIITLNELNEIIGGEDFKSFPAHEWLNESTLIVSKGSEVLALDIESKSSRSLLNFPKKSEYPKINDQKSACAYILENNIIVQTSDKNEKKITADGGGGIVYGQTVHRSEFGIHEGFFWSPDGSKLAFYRMDETMVEDYPLVNISTIPASLNLIKYPMAGKTSHHVSLGVYDLKSDTVVYMNTEGPKDQYLTSVGWTPNSKSLIIGVLNRDQNHLKVNRYSSESGKLENALFEETHDKYVEPEHAPWFVPGSADEFIWMSERSGFQHCYLYKTDGTMVRQLTSGLWEAHEILGLDETGKLLYVAGTGETNTSGRWPTHEYNGTQNFIYQVFMDGSGHSMVNDTKGTHSAMLSPNGKYLIDNFTSIDVPGTQTILETSGQLVREISKAADPLADYDVRKPELIQLSAGDGSVMFGRIIKPFDFDPNKKYPTLVYVYGGPHAQLVTDSYLASASLWMYWFANQGYIVATLDSRGSSNRGLEFEQVTFRNLGANEVDDQQMFANYLKSQPYVDGDRMALHGWSYGGFMTINTLLTYPSLFKVGVAGGPVCSWNLYEVMYTERYMDTPETNPQGYENSNLIKRASNLKDDLLVIHGTVDDVVVWQHSQQLIKSCVDSGVQLDYFIYPGHPHNVRGKDRVHLMTKVLTYIDDRIGNH